MSSGPPAKKFRLIPSKPKKPTTNRHAVRNQDIERIADLKRKADNIKIPTRIYKRDEVELRKQYSGLVQAADDLYSEAHWIGKQLRLREIREKLRQSEGSFRLTKRGFPLGRFPELADQICQNCSTPPKFNSWCRIINLQGAYWKRVITHPEPIVGTFPHYRDRSTLICGQTINPKTVVIDKVTSNFIGKRFEFDSKKNCYVVQPISSKNGLSVGHLLRKVAFSDITTYYSDIEEVSRQVRPAKLKIVEDRVFPRYIKKSVLVTNNIGQTFTVLENCPGRTAEYWARSSHNSWKYKYFNYKPKILRPLHIFRDCTEYTKAAVTGGFIWDDNSGPTDRNLSWLRTHTDNQTDKSILSEPLRIEIRNWIFQELIQVFCLEYIDPEQSAANHRLLAPYLAGARTDTEL